MKLAPTLLLSMGALLSASAIAAPETINSTAGCVIATQLAADGARLASNRVCGNINEEVALFPQRMMGEQGAPGRFGPVALTRATLRMTGMLSRFETADGRQARVEITEKGPVRETRSLSVSVSLEAKRPVRIALPSGRSLTLEMDHSSVPTTFEQALGSPSAAAPERRAHSPHRHGQID